MITLLFSFLTLQAFFNPFGTKTPKLVVSQRTMGSYFCSARKWPSVLEMEKYLVKKHFFPRDESEYFLGVRLRDESSELKKLFIKLNKQHFFRGSACKNLICLAKQSLGKRAIMYMYMLSKYGINLIPRNTEGISVRNFELLKKALLLLPEHLEYDFGGVTVMRAPKTTRPSATIAAVDPVKRNLIFYLNMNSSRYSENEVVGFLYHELAHLVDLSLGHQSERMEWTILSEWSESFEKGWKAKKKKEFVSQYSMKHPTEDFAEAFTAYRFDPERLLKHAPAKYGYMKEIIYLGKEYRKKVDCSKQARFRRFITQKSDEEVTRDYYNKCFYSTYGMLERSDELKLSCLEYFKEEEQYLKERDYLSSHPIHYKLKLKLMKNFQFPLKAI